MTKVPDIIDHWIGIADQHQYIFETYFADDYKDLDISKVTQSQAVGFLNGEVDKICIVKNGKNNTWGLPGGSVEIGETPTEAFIREIKEETNAEVESYKLLAYQNAKNITLNEEVIQLRFICNLIQKEKFMIDPAETIVEVKFVSRDEISKIIEEGKWVDSRLQLIDKAIEMKNKNLI